MKISQGRIDITQLKGLPRMNVNVKKVVVPKIDAQKSINVKPGPALNVMGHLKTLPKPAPVAAGRIKDEYTSLKEAAIIVQQIRLSAQQELEQIRKMRADAVRYEQETTTKARSNAHQLILRTRLETQREIEELIRKASQEIQKVLADIRVIRITAQEELATQRKFTDAAKLSSMSLSIKQELARTERKKRKQLVVSKS